MRKGGIELLLFAPLERPEPLPGMAQALAECGQCAPVEICVTGACDIVIGVGVGKVADAIRYPERLYFGQ